MLDDPAGIAGMVDHPDWTRAVPTPDHFLPLLSIVGLAGRSGDATDVLVDGDAYGSLSMTSYTVGLPCRSAGGAEADAGETPADTPPDSSNT